MRKTERNNKQVRNCGVKVTGVFNLSNLALLPFIACVYFLMGLGSIFGLTYKKISVIFNLWLQGTVLMLSGVAPVAACMWKLATVGSPIWLAAAIPLLAYAGIHVWGFRLLLRHYRLPYDSAFQLCVKDLEHLAHRWHTTYEIVNLIIFVFLFLLLVGLNLLIAWWIV